MDTAMVMVETGDMDIMWECESCGVRFDATARMECSTHCPNCDRPIVEWVGLYDDDQPANNA